jgi:competence protein ComGC
MEEQRPSGGKTLAFILLAMLVILAVIAVLAVWASNRG